jgi:class I fructose-bisphosphate aldolase
MTLSPPLQNILSFYESENAGVRSHLVQLLQTGHLSGSGKFMVYAIDQGFEHGPGRSFALNPASYHPYYHVDLAIEGGFSGLAAPLGFLEVVAHRYAGQIPFILKVNHSYALHPHSGPTDQAVISTIKDALRLGCIGIGFTIYPGSSMGVAMFEEARSFIAKAKKNGLLAFIWSYPRGEALSKDGETALDTVAYGVQLACLLGAHIIKAKIPTCHLETKEAQQIYPKHVLMNTLTDRIRHIIDSALGGQRLVAFSGGEVHLEQSIQTIYEEVQAIINAGAAGSIIARNCYKRPRQEALEMIHEMMRLYSQSSEK